MALSFKPKEGETTPLAKKAFCLVVMAITLMVVVLSSRPMLSKPMVEQKLHSFGDLLAAHFRQAGASAEFTWQDVDVHSLGTKAIVLHPAITLSDLAPGAPRTTINTDKLVFVPVREKDVDYKVLFPVPVTVTDTAGHVTQVRAEGGMPVYSFGTRKDEQATVFFHRLQLPPRLIFSAGAVPAGTTVSFAPDSMLSLSSYSDGRSAAELSFQNIVIADNSGAFTVSAGSLKADAHDDAARDGRIPFESTLTLADVSLKTGESQQGPYTIKLSVSGTKAVPAVEGARPTDIDITLREFSVGSEKFTLTASGTISRKPDDPLPFGKVDVKIEHFSALRDGTGIPPAMKPLLVDVFSRITGADASKAEDVQFTIAREKLGKTSIGNSSPEEIAALLFSHAVSGSGAPAAPVPAPSGGTTGVVSPAAPATGGAASPQAPVPTVPAPTH